MLEMFYTFNYKKKDQISHPPKEDTSETETES